jgi:hypothetical protein
MFNVSFQTIHLFFFLVSGNHVVKSQFKLDGILFFIVASVA